MPSSSRSPSPPLAMYPTPPPPAAQWEDADPIQPPPQTASAPPLHQPLAGDVTWSHQLPRTAGLHVPTHPPAPWSSDLFDCFDDVGNCCVTCLCPCVTFGQVAEIVDRGSTSCGASGALYALIMCVTGWPCMYSCIYRSKMRRLFFLQETPCADCLVHCCCESCALCQEYRELSRRGFDVRRGWKASMERAGRPLTLPPAVEGDMTR